MKNWLDKHQKFCVKNRLFGCVRDLYEYLVLSEGENQHIEVDLKHEFNRYIAKHRGQPYHRDTIKRAWDKLVQLKLIIVSKKYSWCVWACTLLSLDQLKPRKNARRRDSPRGFAPSKGSNLVEELQQQQHIFSRLLEAVDIKLQPKYLKRLLKFTKTEIEDAIALFKIRTETSEIKNPAGFIIDCLHNGWCYEGANARYFC
jgi:hypothetical protein